jgi:hypothetical protein
LIDPKISQINATRHQRMQQATHPAMGQKTNKVTGRELFD